MLDDFVPCDKCKNGYIIDRDKAYKCSCLLDYQNKNKIDINLKRANLNSDIIDYNINNYVGNDATGNIEKIKKFLNLFSEKFCKVHLYFYGKNSTQKTTLASYIGRELTKKGTKVYFVIMNDLVRALVQKDFNEEKYKELINKIYYSDLLIIDDSFCKQKNTIYASQYQLPFLDSFLRDRLENKQKSTIFTSNVSRETIDESLFGKSIKELILRTTQPLEFVDNVNIINNFNGSIWED